MKLLDERTQVREVASRWRRQYGEGTYGMDKRGRMVGRELAALNVETATAEEVAEIVGNGGWVCPQKCHECGVSSWLVVEVGEEQDYESSTAQICADCLRKALSLVSPPNAKMSRAPAKPEVPPLSEASASIAGLAFPWFGELGIVGWHSCIWQRVKVVGETPKRYRIEATERTKLAGRCRWLEVGQTALVPKGAIRKANAVMSRAGHEDKP